MQANSYSYMFIKFRSYDYWFLSHVNSICRFRDILFVTHDSMDFKRTKRIFHRQLFEEVIIASKDNSCHLFFT